MRSGPLVLCYHAVSEQWEDPLAVRAAALERQVATLLARGLAPVPAGEAVAGRGRTLHVTFDDAYRNIAPALQALQRMGVPATVFACSGLAGEGLALTVPELRVRARDSAGELSTMAWPALREWAGRGVEIGSHTCSHPHLPELDDAALARELRDSREQIEAELQRPCRLLAYPYGEHDARVRAAARAAGYAAAFTLGGRRRDARGDGFAIPRVDVYRGDGAARFALKTSPLRAPAALAAHAARALLSARGG